MRAAYLLALVALLAPGCRRAVAPAGARAVRDGMGREVRLPSKVARVVALAPSTTEILYAIGAGPALVGVDAYSDFPAAASSVARVGADDDPSLERIVALRPDVVFTATSANSRATAESIERLGIPVFVSRAESLEEVYADIRTIGEAVGRAPEARALADGMHARVAAVVERRRGGPRVTTLVVVWSDPLVVAGRASHVGDLIHAAGGENVADDSAHAFPTYSVERVIARAPEVVLLGSHSHGSPPVAPIERLGALLGPRRFRIEPVDGDLLFRPGPRLADGVEAIDRLLHPVAR